MKTKILLRLEQILSNFLNEDRYSKKNPKNINNYIKQQCNITVNDYNNHFDFTNQLKVTDYDSVEELQLDYIRIDNYVKSIKAQLIPARTGNN